MLDTTVFSSPKRDAGITGGSAKWRGNHPPTLSRDLFLWLQPRQVLDPMCGSGTTGDVARQMDIPCWQSDLYQGFNVVQDEFPLLGDLVFPSTSSGQASTTPTTTSSSTLETCGERSRTRMT